jgi:hypothetical protein
MNSSTRGDRYFYPEDFEPPPRWRRLLLILALILLAAFTHYLAFLAGAAMNDSRCRTRVAAATATRPTCATLAPASDSHMQWKCTASAFKKHRDACKDRLLSDFGIPPKE